MSFINRLFVLLILILMASSANAAPTWKIEKIDKAAPGNRMVQLFIAKNNDKHLVYTGCSDRSCAQSELFYSFLAEGKKWEKKSIDSNGKDTGWFPSMSFDSNSAAHLFYANHKTETLQYATNKDGKWTTQSLGEGRGGWWTSSAAANGKVYFAHTKLQKKGWENAALQVGILENGKWTYEIVDATSNSGWFSSMTMMPNGNPIISYSSVINIPVGTAKLAMKVDNGWDLIDIDSNAIKHHVAVDALGNVHVIYQKILSNKNDSQGEEQYNLMYVTNTGGSWKRTIVQESGKDGIKSTGGFPRITTDSAGGLHAAYIMNNDQLMYARKLSTNSNWEFFPIDELGGSLYPWIEIDQNGKVVVAYERTGSIYLATCAGCSK